MRRMCHVNANARIKISPVIQSIDTFPLFAKEQSPHLIPFSCSLPVLDSFPGSPSHSLSDPSPPVKLSQAFLVGLLF